MKNTGRNLDRRYRVRTRRGANVIELAASVTAFSIIVLLCVNIAIVVYATAVHDRCCREAARAASLGSSKTAAMSLAAAALSACRTDGFIVSQPWFSPNDIVYQDYGGTPAPDQVPTVTLATHCKIRLPVSAWLGTSFFGTSDGLIHASCRYVFPLTNLQVPIP